MNDLPVGKRVLVVEDDGGFRELLDVVLSMDDQVDEVLTVEDGPTALSRCQEFDPDVVVIDMIMPDMNGDEVCARIRETNPGVRIISLSGMEEDSAGWADQHVVKASTTLDDLRSAIFKA